MLLEPCFTVTLHDERGDSNQMLLEPCFSVTRHDERGGVPIKCSWSNAFL